MAIHRLQKTINSQLHCFEYDEWATINQMQEIDCALSSPTKQSTPMPPSIIMEKLQSISIDLRMYSNMQIQEQENLNYDEFIALYPELDINSEATMEYATQYALDNYPEDPYAFEEYFNNYQFYF